MEAAGDLNEKQKNGDPERTLGEKVFKRSSKSVFHHVPNLRAHILAVSVILLVFSMCFPWFVVEKRTEIGGENHHFREEYYIHGISWTTDGADHHDEGWESWNEKGFHRTALFFFAFGILISVAIIVSLAAFLINLTPSIIKRPGFKLTRNITLLSVLMLSFLIIIFITYFPPAFHDDALEAGGDGTYNSLKHVDSFIHGDTSSPSESGSEPYYWGPGFAFGFIIVALWLQCLALGGIYWGRLKEDDYIVEGQAEKN